MGSLASYSLLLFHAPSNGIVSTSIGVEQVKAGQGVVRIKRWKGADDAQCFSFHSPPLLTSLLLPGSQGRGVSSYYRHHSSSAENGSLHQRHGPTSLPDARPLI